MTSETQSMTVRLPVKIHQDARLKSVRTKKSLNSVITEKIQEWLNEDDKAPQTRKTRTAPKQATMRASN